MKTNIRIQLSVMMFIQFFIWGSWYVTANIYLKKIGFGPTDVGSIYSTISLAAIVAPLFVGIIADRFFEAQKVLAVSHLVGAGLLYYVSTINEYSNFYWFFLLYAIFYMPTIALTNAISFHQMKDPGKEFPAIRVLGTIGFIAAGWAINNLKLESSNLQFVLAAAGSLLLGVYSFTLPNTPAKSKGEKVNLSKLLGLDAFGLMKKRNFAILVISSFLVSIPLNFYFVNTGSFLDELGIQDIAGKMSMGQMSEIIFMLLMPFFFKRLGVKKMILIGIAAWILRYILFAYGDNQAMVWMLYAGIILHGICYDFFFVTGQIYVDNEAPEELRASAQGLITLATYGIGMYIGAIFSGRVVKHFEVVNNDAISYQWWEIWMTPAVLAVGVLLVFWLFFREEEKIA